MRKVFFSIIYSIILLTAISFNAHAIEKADATITEFELKDFLEKNKNFTGSVRINWKNGEATIMYLKYGIRQAQGKWYSKKEVEESDKLNNQNNQNNGDSNLKEDYNLFGK